MDGLTVGKSLCGLALCTFLFAVSAHAECSAYAEPSGDANITDKAHYFVAFKVEARPCKAGCHGWVEFRVHYTVRNGENYAVSNLVKWESKAGEPTRVTKESYASDLCLEHSLGPCQVQHIEIEKVSCREG